MFKVKFRGSWGTFPTDQQPRQTVLYHLTDLSPLATEADLLSHLASSLPVIGARDEMEILLTGESIQISGDQ